MPHGYSVRSGPHVNENKSMCSSARNRFRPTVSAWPVYQLSSFLHTIPYTPIRRHGPHAQPSYALVAMNPVHAIITVAQAPPGLLSRAVTAVITASNSAGTPKPSHPPTQRLPARDTDLRVQNLLIRPPHPRAHGASHASRPDGDVSN